MLHEKPQEASNKLATTLLNLNERKVKKLKEKCLQHSRAYLLHERLTSREVAGEVFDAIKTNNNFTSIATINAELTRKLVRRLHLDRLLWLLEKGVFNKKNITRTLQVVIASLNEK